MSKTARVYFGVLHRMSEQILHFLPLSLSLSSHSLFFFLSFVSLCFFLLIPFLFLPPLRTGHLLFIAIPTCMHVDTWLAMCHSHGFPWVLHAGILTHGLLRVTHMACYVSPDTKCLEKHEISIISEFNEILLGN